MAPPASYELISLENSFLSLSNNTNQIHSFYFSTLQFQYIKVIQYFYKNLYNNILVIMYVVCTVTL